MLHATLSDSIESSVQQADRQLQRLRFITATSLFDGHDAAINIMRRILQSKGVEVIHLGHNRSVNEIITAAIQEDADAIAVSSYQGGHIEFYRYLVDQLRANQATSIKVFGGGGGVIPADEITQLHNYGVTRIYAPEDGQKLGLDGMIDDVIERTRQKNKTTEQVIKTAHMADNRNGINPNWRRLAKTLTGIETGTLNTAIKQRIKNKAKNNQRKVAVLGITGPGGAGKSSLMDELLQRFRTDYRDQLNIAILAIDPTRKKTSGALLGDRLRMNAIDSQHVFMRSMATRGADNEIPQALPDCIQALIAESFDLVIVETPGIGQGDTGIVSLVDASLYVMTHEYGAATQLEKLNILDYADLVAINKFDRQGSNDALSEVRKQLQRNREQFNVAPDEMPVYGTIASQLNDQGVDCLYTRLRNLLVLHGLPPPLIQTESDSYSNLLPTYIIPSQKQGYLSDIADCVKKYHHHVEQQSQLLRKLHHLTFTDTQLGDASPGILKQTIDNLTQQIDPECNTLLDTWSTTRQQYLDNETGDDHVKRSWTTLSGLTLPRVALPDYHDQGDLLNWLMLENLPGYFPFTAGVFPFKRRDEEPTRMFAGEGDPYRTNRRFKYLAAHSDVNRLSTAFDSVTLYGCDPDYRPDIYGKIGNSGVSVATLDDMHVLYDGFDLCDPKTSVSMTINGPAPIILAMFFNTAIDQQLERFVTEHQRQPDQEELTWIRDNTLKIIRGTVQADILKEDQGQNTCLFSTTFSLKLMGDIQQYFIDHQIRHFYSVSISGYHIAEAGANPITQLAFTLANGFTYVEAFLARGMDINDFAHRLSFFFSNGMDPEYSVIGRVARRIWAITMRNRYGADQRCQKLKYHIQTSGRSLHAQAMNFNEIRTTLQALIAIYDNCNSLHTNARDEALTTPSEESVREAMAIQMIIDKEWGLAGNDNPNQGAFIIDRLTNLVENAVLMEFERLSARGGVLGAMENGYQRRTIQQESLIYETAKHDGSLPIVGVNLYQSMATDKPHTAKLARSTEDEKNSQIKRLQQFKHVHREQSTQALEKLKHIALQGDNVFAELMETVQVCTLGEITQALFEVGGKYRRNM